MPDPIPPIPRKKGLRWWPAALLICAAVVVVARIRSQADHSYQERNLSSLSVVLIACLLLFLWWLTLSRAAWRLRLWVAAPVLGGLGLACSLFTIRGVSGDLLPIIAPRWSGHGPGRPEPQAATQPGPNSAPPNSSAFDYPQFLGPNRTGCLSGPALDPDWQKHPPQILWRQPIGAGWAGWAIVGPRALTQEQRGEDECCTCYELLTGRLLWSHADPAHYNSTIAGEGPRCTPTVVSNRVFTLGALGQLDCLDLGTGNKLWSHNIASDADSKVPEWGFAGSPLVYDGLVVVSAGGSPDRSLLAYRAETGDLAWSGGSQGAGYSSPFLASLAGVRQILAFNTRKISSHDPKTGTVLWEYPWGHGQPHVAVPVVAATNQVLFSSGYGVGSELIEIRAEADGKLSANQIWKSTRLKAKFANPVARGGFVYGLDDGVLTCLDLRSGGQRWKEGRYGHGQGLLINDLYLLMAESGELVLLRLSPDAPAELGRLRVFNSKTWNPIALAGELLLVRNDQEAACLRLPLAAALGALQKPAKDGGG